MMTLRFPFVPLAASLLSTCLPVGCASPDDESASTSESADTASAASTTACPTKKHDPACPAGQFMIKCKDGSRQVATTAQITSNQVCNVASPPLVPPASASAPTIYCEPWRYDQDSGRTQTWGDFLVYRGAVARTQFPQQLGSLRYGMAEITSTSPGFPFVVRVSISDGTGKILERKVASLAKVGDGVSVSDDPARYNDYTDAYTYAVRCKVELD